MWKKYEKKNEEILKNLDEKYKIKKLRNIINRMNKLKEKRLNRENVKEFAKKKNLRKREITKKQREGAYKENVNVKRLKRERVRGKKNKERKQKKVKIKKVQKTDKKRKKEANMFKREERRRKNKG